MKNKLFGALALAFLSTLNPQLSTAFAQGTALTYQGRLNDSGTPANGAYDLEFRVFDMLSGGSQQGGTATVDDLGITNGLFTATLDFGSAPFSGGANRWLNLAVRPGASTGAYTNVTPRQPITAAPYAVYAGGVSATGISGTIPGGSLGGTYTNVVTFSNAANNFSGSGAGLTGLNASQLSTGTVADARLSANVALRSGGNTFSGTNLFNDPVGIGTATPGAPLSLGSSNANTKLAIWDGGPTNAMGFGVAASQFRIHLPNSGNRFSFLDASAGNELMTIKGTGSVGIGTVAPAGQLALGDALPGTSGSAVLTYAKQLYLGGSYDTGANSTNAVKLYIAQYNNDAPANVYPIYVEDENNIVDFYLHTLGVTNKTAYFGGRVGIGTTNPATALEVNGTVTAGAFSGNGATLTNLQLGGTYSNAVTFSNAANLLAGTFSGNGAGLTLLNASQLSSGTVADARLSTNVALLNASQAFTGNTGIRQAPFANAALAVSRQPGGGTNFAAAFADDLGNPLVTIGHSGGYHLQLYADSAGKPNGGSWANSSDARLKKNIQPLTGALDKLAQLRGVRFEWVNPEDHANQHGPQGGFIAQEVERTFPRWITPVAAAEHDRALTADGQIKSLTLPFEFDALVVEAIKEQQQQIKARDAEIGELKQRLDALEKLMNRLTVAKAGGGR